MRSLQALACCIVLLPITIRAQDKPLTAEEIMARVAVNQDRSEAERARYVYVQHARVSSRRGKTILCEETTDTRVTPGATGSTQTLLHLDGRLLKGKTYITYDQPEKQLTKAERAKAAADEAAEEKQENDKTLPKEERKRLREERKKREAADDDPMDQDLVENMRDNLTNEKSKDGLHAGLFPLTGKAQADYAFTLKGRERRNGHDTFHITFTPRDKDDFGWRGDAWIDTEAFQPVMVQTAMARNIPFAVRFMLGTSVPGLGFAATYAQQPDGTWFPVTFGSEFKINVLFFFHRTVVINVANRDFEKTHTSSRILPETEAAPAANP